MVANYSQTVMANIPRVYSLINTPIASLLAYEIALLPSQPKVPQVVLLLNDQKTMNRFLENDSKVTIQIGKDANFNHTQFMASHLPPVYSSGDTAIMDNVIVSGQHTKGFTFSIEKYIKSLNPTSNVLLLNPPFGTIEYLYRKVWQTIDSRPNLFIGITAQREERIAVNTDEFAIKVKNSKLSLRISPIPRDFSNYSHEDGLKEIQNLKETNDLLNLLKDTAEIKSKIAPLDLTFYSYGELLLVRLERLIADSCIEPLAALYGCRYNGELLKADKIKDIIYKLVHEQVWILRNTHTFLANLPNYSIALDHERLYELIIKELKNSTKKTSRMRHALDQLNKTDINQRTGYFVQLANYKKLDCKWNEVITGLVKGKVALTKHRALNYHYL